MMGTVVVLAAIALAVYGILLALLYTMQSRLVHLPSVAGRELVTTPADVGLPWEDVRLTTADGVALHGWYLPAPGEARRTVLFFHGNAGNISHRLDTLETFHRLGVTTLIIDYRGYGQSEGSPSEPGLYRDAEAAWRHLTRERGVDPGRVIAFGRSLGAPVAARLAAEQPVGGLVLESAFTSVPDLAAELYPIFPVRALTRIEYPTRKFVTRVDAPVLVIHSPEDEMIPFRHGQTVYEAARQPKRFLRIEGDHNTGFQRSGDLYIEGLRDWLESLDERAAREVKGVPAISTA
ncbi:MAG: alpha/beta hydrolase [Halofilum sp. (in: g-proteobacteria)]